MGPTHTIAFTAACAGDTDYFMLQPLSILDKDSAAAVATTHQRGVSAAESMAALLGYRGARFPTAIEGRDGYSDGTLPLCCCLGFVSGEVRLLLHCFLADGGGYDHVQTPAAHCAVV